MASHRRGLRECDQGRENRDVPVGLKSHWSACSPPYASSTVISSGVRKQQKALHSGFIELGSLRVHHTHGGRGSPVLFIHGLGSSGYIEWRFNLDATSDRHRVYAPDLPGFGRSEKPRARYGIQYFTRFIERYMDDRGLRSAAVVGASLGGRIALELALENPRRVSKLVLVNASLLTRRGF